MTTPITPAEIAASLTDAQRRWIAGKGAGAKCTKRLAELGLIRPYNNTSWMVLPLGLAVRDIIQEQSI